MWYTTTLLYIWVAGKFASTCSSDSRSGGFKVLTRISTAWHGYYYGLDTILVYTSDEKISGPKRSITITDHFTCTSANVINYKTCTLCKKLYISKTGRRLGDRLWEHLCDVEKDDKNASKPVARHFNLPNYSKQHFEVCSISLRKGSMETAKL